MLAAPLPTIRTEIRTIAHADEKAVIADLIAMADLSAADRAAIAAQGADWVAQVRAAGNPGMMEAFLAEYGLSTEEGVALMCLAEALLRVPDAETIDDLIRDKITPHDWGAHLGGAASSLVNASTWALLLTGQVLEDGANGLTGALRGMVRRMGEPVIRTAVARAMREMAAQFVLGRTIAEAMDRGAAMVAKGYAYSYDMLGEAAMTHADASRYFTAYGDAIAAIAKQAPHDDIRANPGISVKLSALHPRYEVAQAAAMTPLLCERLLQLCQAAKAGRIGLNIDAEEAERLDLSLDIIETVLADPSLAGWGGFGVVVQAYGKRAAPVLDWLYMLAARLDRRIMVRLVKGAYWDTEVKRAQVMGLGGFPVFTRKSATDVSYIACARKLMGMRDRIYPQFATHNAHTLAAVEALAGGQRGDYETQRLHGMGEALHDVAMAATGARCRIYAPVGAHRDLLAYLVRRLLENGANSSFVNQIVDENVSPEQVAADPFDHLGDGGLNPAIKQPAELFCGRRNAKGWDLYDPIDLAQIDAGRAPFAAPHQWGTGAVRVTNPADPAEIVGYYDQAACEAAPQMIDRALTAAPDWSALGAPARAEILNRAADLYEDNAHELLAITAREAGKTLMDGVAELREAVDFIRYYANESLTAQGDPRGVVVCISPWNFPLAIFTGQIVAALAAGNAVIAKPAEQTPLVAARAIDLLHQAGVPAAALQLAQGPGATLGAALVADPRIGGVCFTGSTATAKRIDRQLAETAPDAMLIAETGGINAMLVDSTALPEQAVRDIVAGAFQSAGQRCSALRVLYVQADVEDRLLEMLYGAMDALDVSAPWNLNSDLGPVIDKAAQDSINAYIETRRAEGRVMKQLAAPGRGTFIAPTVIRVDGINDVTTEVFGPVLHVARYQADQIDQVLADVKSSGYGLTMGLHTRIDARVQHVVDRAAVGNLYVNRNQIGAVVGSQPFGGEGLSGTGPKAGGPHYLHRFLADAGASAPAAGDMVAAKALAEAAAGLDRTAWAAWAARKDRISALRGALRGRAATAMGAAAAVDAGSVDLPGPTGESNRLRLRPRGLVLCLGPTPDLALDQAVQALRMGNAVLAVAPGAPAMLAPLMGAGAPLAVIDGVAAPDAAAALAADGVALSLMGPALAPYRRALAAGEGAIIPIITARIAPAAYALERAVCIDTTAAGGDAALLAAAG